MRAKKLVAVSSFCEWSSYGSVLQAIALKHTLFDLGFDSFIVRDVPAPVAKKNFRFALSKKPKKLIKEIVNIRYKKQFRSLYENCVAFINKNADVKYYNNYEVLRKSPPKADFYIAGSDQVWHPNVCKPAFFLDFVPPEKKRLSYAASMGTTKVPEEKEALFSEMVSNFDTISVREAEMQEVLRKYTNKPIARHIDPTFLVNADFWRTFSSEYPIKKPYILVYALYWESKYNKELKNLRKETGYDIIAVSPTGSSSVWANKRLVNVHPGEFLHLIDNAAAVVSSSFHGVALALNFNKKVSAVINQSIPSRINTLLDVLDVKNPAISEVMSFDLSKYESINQKIEAEKEKAIEYLKEALI